METIGLSIQVVAILHLDIREQAAYFDVVDGVLVFATIQWQAPDELAM